MNEYDPSVAKRMKRDKTLLACVMTTALIRGGVIGSVAMWLLAPVLGVQGYTAEWMLENLVVFGACYLVIILTMGAYVRINYPDRLKRRAT